MYFIEFTRKRNKRVKGEERMSILFKNLILNVTDNSSEEMSVAFQNYLSFAA